MSISTSFYTPPPFLLNGGRGDVEEGLEDFFLEESLLGKGGQFLDGVWGY